MKFKKISRIRRWLAWKLFLYMNNFPFELERGGWSLRVDDFNALFNKVRKEKTQKALTFVELGGGISTILFGFFLSRLNAKSTVISFEADKDWVKEVDVLIKAYGLNQQVGLYHVPYKQYVNKIWFDEDQIAKILKGRRIDVLFVDAPKGHLCPYARKPAIPFFLPWLHEESMVFIHDANRKDETETAQEWSKYFKVYENIGTDLGLVLLMGKREKL